MITKIEYIKKHGLFENFRWNNDIKEFSNYNLIYGWNYSGKTTLSRIFRCIELEQMHHDFPNCIFELSYNNSKISKSNLNNHPFHFRVFNTDYIKENLKWEEQEANPIFILGKKDIELQEKLKNIYDDIETIKDDIQKKTSDKNDLQSSIESLLTAKARELDRIKPPYDKRKFKQILQTVKNDIQKYKLDKAVVQKLIDTIKSSKKEQIGKIEIDYEINEKEYLEILDKSVVAKTIERLKTNPDLNTWVNTGLKFHKDKKKCEFCGQDLPEGLIKSYEEHFSKDYEILLNELKQIIQRTKTKSIELTLPDKNSFYPQFMGDFQNIKSTLEQEIKTYNKGIKNIIVLLERKQSNPFNFLSSEFKAPETSMLNKTLQSLNELIQQHNEYDKNLGSEKESAFEELEKHYAYEFDHDNNYYQELSTTENLESEIKNLEQQKDAKIKTAAELEAKLSDISKAADTINEYLESIFGGSHLQVKPTNDDKFELIRNNEKAKNLSEGEKTSIAFAYFLTRLKDKETDLSKSIVFIDDPISSLDSNHLYNTYATIRSEVEKCKQLFVSTHNLEFFNLLKDWMKKIRGNKEKCRYYLIERINKNDSEIASLKNLPKFLLKYKSEYYFLFDKINTFSQSPSTDFEDLYQIPNVIRRFLEAFVGFKYGVGLKKGLEFIIHKDAERICVDKFVNNLSHQTGLNRNLIFADINECKKVVDIVLDAVKNKDQNHYSVLMQVCNDAQDSDANN